MTLSASYKSGTITVSAGGTQVIGAGTSWTGFGVREGDILWAAGIDVAVASVEGPDALTLAFPWAGPALSGSAYEIRPTPDAARVLTASREAIASIEDFRGDIYASANVYPTTAAGLAATQAGAQFQVRVGTELVRYRNDPGPVATELARYMTAPAVTAAVAQATAKDASLTLAIRDGAVLPLTNIGGTGDAITADLQATMIAAGITTLSAIAEVEYIPVAGNTAADPTLTVAGVTYTIKDFDGGIWPAGGFVTNRIYKLRRRGQTLRVTSGNLSRTDVVAQISTEAAARAAGDTASRDRTTHTGTQPINTVTGLSSALDGLSQARIDGDAAEAAARAAGDTASRDRTTHTGTQPISTVTGLPSALDGLSQARIDGDAAEAAARAADIATLRPLTATITATSGGVERNAATWTRAPATRRVTAAQITNAPPAVAQPSTATVTTAPHPDGAELTWADDSGDTWRAVWSSASNTLGTWAQIARRPDAADLTVTLTETSIPAARDLSTYTTSGATLAINPGTAQGIISNAPATVGTKPTNARAWTLRESGQMVQYFQEATGRRWRRSYDGAAWSGWVISPRLSAAAGRATMIAAAATAARMGAVPTALRGELSGAADLYIPPPATDGGAVASLMTAGEWAAALAPSGTGTAPAQVAGGYKFAGAVELATAVTAYAAPVAAPRMAVFVDFTVDAQPPSGTHYIAAFATAPATRFALSMLGEGAGYFSLSLKLPGDVVIEDRSMIYPVGARVRAVIGADFAGGSGYLAQAGLVRRKPFAPPAGGALLVQKLRLGATCQITLHEIAVFAR